MKKESKTNNGFAQRIFSAGSRLGGLPLRSNVYGRGGGMRPGGYSTIGGASSPFGSDQGRVSPLLGTAQPSNCLSGYYDRIHELKGYQLLDITKLAVSLFNDYLINFLTKESKHVITIDDSEGNTDEEKTRRINQVLIEQINIFDYIEDHLPDSIFFGSYTSMLTSSKDEEGHAVFKVEELYDPSSAILKKERNEDGEIEEVYLVKGEDGDIYELPKHEAFFMGSSNLRLINDLKDSWNGSGKKFEFNPTDPSKWHLGILGNEKSNYGQKKKELNRDKIISRESYVAGEPLFYSLILKVKDLVVKELLISLLSLRDLTSPALFGLAVDKNTTLEMANNLCANTEKRFNGLNELSSFVSANFDITGLIETTLSKTAIFYPDYNGTISNKTTMLPTDKLSDKLMEIMQVVDGCRQAVLSPLGIPASIYDSATGSKWSILQQSERANSRVASLMAGIKSSITALVQAIHSKMYNEEIGSGNIKIHIFEKSSVEYNNQLNQSESITNLFGGISNLVTMAMSSLEASGGLIDAEAYVSYLHSLIKDVDPAAASILSEKSISEFIQMQKAKQDVFKQQFMAEQQMGMEGEEEMM